MPLWGQIDFLESFTLKHLRATLLSYKHCMGRSLHFPYYMFPPATYAALVERNEHFIPVDTP